MSTDFAVRYPGYYPHIKHPLKWILTYSNSRKNSQDLSALGVLLNRVDPIKKMSTPITRTNFKQQLQRQQLEQQDQLFQTQKPSQPDFSQSQSIAVPRTSSPTTVPPDVPSSVLQVWFILIATFFPICGLSCSSACLCEKHNCRLYFRKIWLRKLVDGSCLDSWPQKYIQCGGKCSHTYFSISWSLYLICLP